MVYRRSRVPQSLCSYPSSLPGKDPNGCTTISSQNPTKAHLGPRALHPHTNPSSFPPSSGNGSCCLLRSPSNKTSHSVSALHLWVLPAGPISPREGTAGLSLSWRSLHPQGADGSKAKKWSQSAWPPRWACSQPPHLGHGLWLWQPFLEPMTKC